MNSRYWVQCFNTFLRPKFTKVRDIFVPARPFQSSIMFVRKARAYPSESPLRLL
jgi:hypothetical protein